jgi:hypothetical protein
MKSVKIYERTKADAEQIARLRNAYPSGPREDVWTVADALTYAVTAKLLELHEQWPEHDSHVREMRKSLAQQWNKPFRT